MTSSRQLKLAAAAAAAALLAAACGSNAATNPEPPAAQPPPPVAPAPAPAPTPPPDPIAEPEPPAAEPETTAALELPAPQAILETATRIFIEVFGNSAATDAGPSGVLLIAYEEAPSAFSAGDATIDGATLDIEGDPLAVAVAQSLVGAGLAASVSRVEVRAAGMDERYVRHFGGGAAPNAYIVRLFGQINPQRAADALQALEAVRYACHAYCEDPNPPEEAVEQPALANECQERLNDPANYTGSALGGYFRNTFSLVYKNPVINPEEQRLQEGDFSGVEEIFLADLNSLKVGFNIYFDIYNVRVTDVFESGGYSVEADGDFDSLEVARALCMLDRIKYTQPGGLVPVIIWSRPVTPAPPPVVSPPPIDARPVDPGPFIRCTAITPECGHPYQVHLWHNTIRVREGEFAWALVNLPYTSRFAGLYDYTSRESVDVTQLLELRKMGGPNDDDIYVTSPPRERSNPFAPADYSQDFLVWGRRDETDEGVESVELKLVSGNPSLVRVTGNSTLTVEIVDEETPFLWFDSGKERYLEGDTLSITVRAYPPPKQPLNFTLELTEGDPNDFTGFPAVGRLESGRTEVNFDNIAILDDGASEEREDFAIQIKLQDDSREQALISNEAYLNRYDSTYLGAYDSAHLGINEIAFAGYVTAHQEAESSTVSLPLEVRLVDREYNAVEGGYGTDSSGFELNQNTAFGAVQIDIESKGMLNYDLLNLLEIQGAPEEDLHVSNRSSLLSPHKAGFFLHAVRDNLDEPQEQFQITLVSRDTSTVIVRPESSTATVTITDGNLPAIWLSPAASYESGAVSLTLGSQIPPRQDVSLLLELAEDATATAATIPETWTLQSGTISTTISVDIVNPGETLTFRLTLPESMADRARLIPRPWADYWRANTITFRLAPLGTGTQRTLKLDPASTPPQEGDYTAVEFGYAGSIEAAPLGELDSAFLDTATQKYKGNPSAIKIAKELEPVLKPLNLQIALIRIRYLGQTYEYHDIFVEFTTPAMPAVSQHLDSLSSVDYSVLLPEGQPEFSIICSGCPISRSGGPGG